METGFVRDHKHVIIRAYVNNPPKEGPLLSDWCKNVISDVGMRVIGGPLAVYSDLKGNEGYTAVAILDFSHLAIHVWDNVFPALIEFDLFSCKEFNSDLVLKRLDEFSLESYSINTIYRDEYDLRQHKYNEFIKI